MSYFYGARAGGLPEGQERQVEPIWHDKAGDRRGLPTKHAKKLAHAIYNCIEDMLPRPKAVRDWLEQLARLAAEKGKPLRWTTPLGLPVINIYQPAEVKNLSVCGERSKAKCKTGGRR